MIIPIITFRPPPLTKSPSFLRSLHLRSLTNGPLFRVHFVESLVVRLYSEIDHITLALKLSVSPPNYPWVTATCTKCNSHNSVLKHTDMSGHKMHLMTPWLYREFKYIYGPLDVLNVKYIFLSMVYRLILTSLLVCCGLRLIQSMRRSILTPVTFSLCLLRNISTLSMLDPSKTAILSWFT